MAVECLQVTDLIVRAQAARWQGRAFTADRSGLLRIRLPRGRHELALSEMAGIRSLSSRPQEAAKNGPRPAAIALDLAFDTSLWQARLGSRVSDADAYGNLLAVGGERGDILLLDPWGQSKARIHTGSPIVRLAIAPGAASGMTGVLTGTEDAALALYTLDGECVWRKGLGPGYRQQARRACSLACACGNSPFFLAGLADGSLMAFSAEGAELWQARLSHYPATFLAAIRQEGNGFNIVAGSATAGMYLLDDEGQVLWRSMRGPVLAAAAMVSGGQREIVSGGACGLQGFRQESGETTREINLGGEIIALTAHPADPILYAASSIGQIAAIAPDSILWRIDAGEPVSCMAYAGSHDPSLALGTPGGHIRFHSPADGHLRAVTPASDPVRSLHSGPGILWSVGGAGRIEGVGCSAAP